METPLFVDAAREAITSGAAVLALLSSSFVVGSVMAVVSTPQRISVSWLMPASVLSHKYLYI
jgi:ABC-type arginine/histidine transport system permease subunit